MPQRTGSEREDAAVTPPTGRTGGPPLLNKRMYAPYKIATVIDTAAARGIRPETVLARTGLTLEDVRDPSALTSIRQYLTACDNILFAGADLDLAFTIGSRLHLSAYGMYGYALMCSPTMRDFFEFAVRYHRLATPAFQLGWRREGDRAIWTFTEIYSHLMSKELREFLVRQQLMQISTHMRDVVGPDIRPLKATFALADAGGKDRDEQVLQVPCEFGQAGHELHYPASILDRAPELANRLTRAMLEETCDRLIGQAKMASGISGEVYQLLMLAPNQFPSMQAVALQLGVTERTLRRRLDDENHSYAAIVDDIRKRLALEYLQTTRMSADDIAWNVGFSDSSNLRRAVKRWTGSTFAAVRRR
jgi:AraC-like DNA-binding protein